jgi:hypothetical protein
LIEKQIELTDKGLTSGDSPQNPPPLQWKAKKMDLVELTYALHVTKCFGKTQLKELFKVIGVAFGCDMKYGYRLFWGIRIRTKADRLYFIRRLYNGLKEALRKADEEDSSVKKRKT